VDLILLWKGTDLEPLIWDLQHCIDIKEAKGEKSGPSAWKGNSWVKTNYWGGGLKAQKIN